MKTSQIFATTDPSLFNTHEGIEKIGVVFTGPAAVNCSPWLLLQTSIGDIAINPSDPFELAEPQTFQIIAATVFNAGVAMSATVCLKCEV